MEYENVYRVVSLLTNIEEEKHVNELLESGWKLLKIVQFQDESSSYGKYVLGADSDVYEQNNFDMIKQREKNENIKKYGF